MRWFPSSSVVKKRKSWRPGTLHPPLFPSSLHLLRIGKTATTMLTTTMTKVVTTAFYLGCLDFALKLFLLCFDLTNGFSWNVVHPFFFLIVLLLVFEFLVQILPEVTETLCQEDLLIVFMCTVSVHQLKSLEKMQQRISRFWQFDVTKFYQVFIPGFSCIADLYRTMHALLNWPVT